MSKIVKVRVGTELVMANAELMVIYTVEDTTYLTVSGTNVSLQFRTTDEVIKAMEAIKEFGKA